MSSLDKDLLDTALQTAGGPSPSKRAATYAPAAGAALFLAASAGLLLLSRGGVYDMGAPTARVHISFPTGSAPAAASTAPAPAVRPSTALPSAPIAGLATPGPGGLLPIIAPDGRASWKAYARPFTDDGRPKIALVIGGLGLDPQKTAAAIDQLPPEITLSFSPYAEGLQGMIDRARAAGHEVMLEIPMEPLDYPDDDPGPYTLTASAAPADIGRKLEWLMSRGVGYFAVTNSFGGKFLGKDAAMAPFVQALRQRGVAFVDDGQAGGRGQGLHRATLGPRIDADLDSQAIDNQLLALEAGALQSGGALGTGSAYPLTVTQVKAWAAAVRQRGYALAPASALMVQK